IPHGDLLPHSVREKPGARNTLPRRAAARDLRRAAQRPLESPARADKVTARIALARHSVAVKAGDSPNPERGGLPGRGAEARLAQVWVRVERWRRGAGILGQVVPAADPEGVGEPGLALHVAQRRRVEPSALDEPRAHR